MKFSLLNSLVGFNCAGLTGASPIASVRVDSRVRIFWREFVAVLAVRLETFATAFSDVGFIPHGIASSAFSSCDFKAGSALAFAVCIYKKIFPGKKMAANAVPLVRIVSGDRKTVFNRVAPDGHSSEMTRVNAGAIEANMIHARHVRNLPNKYFIRNAVSSHGLAVFQRATANSHPRVTIAV